MGGVGRRVAARSRDGAGADGGERAAGEPGEGRLAEDVVALRIPALVTYMGFTLRGWGE